MGRGCLAACTWFPPDLVPFNFPLTDFALSFCYHTSELYVWLCRILWVLLEKHWPGVVLREHPPPLHSHNTISISDLSPKGTNICGDLHCTRGFPGGSVIKNLPANAGNTCSIPGSGRSPEGGNGNPLQHSCLGNPMDRGAHWATVHSITKNCT